ncbi:MAG TPA: dihydroorotase family protein [Candidatus Peribacteraceae bacterium]|nr:dihydroorotase family protein [Candidatus Peribacteraceae bacterium]
MPALLLHGGTIVSEGLESRDDLLFENGIVKDIARYIEESDEEIDVTGKLLLPGFIDCHVHFREPGLEQKETMETGAAAALAGGVTTVLDMPNTIPPTVTVSALADKVRRAEEIKNCDIRFFFGITQDVHLAALRELLDSTASDMKHLRSRLAGVKIFLDHSTGDQKVEDALLDDLFQACADHNLPLVAHCEDPDENAKAAMQNTRTGVAVHSLLRPATSEAIAIERAINLARKHGTHLHVAHLTTEGGIDLVRKAKADGLRVTCEVTPHHLILTTDDYEKLGTLIKVNPPIRSAKHRFALWQGIIDGVVDCVSTDHAPHTLQEKQNPEPLKAPSGLPGTETMIPLLLSVAAGHWPNPLEPNATCPPITIKDIVRLCFENPNRIFKLGKQGIEKGVKTDIVIVDPNTTWTIDAAKLHSKCGWSPYDGWSVKGKVEGVLTIAV